MLSFRTYIHSRRTCTILFNELQLTQRSRTFSHTILTARVLCSWLYHRTTSYCSACALTHTHTHTHTHIYTLYPPPPLSRFLFLLLSLSPSPSLLCAFPSLTSYSYVIPEFLFVNRPQVCLELEPYVLSFIIVLPMACVLG